MGTSGGKKSRNSARKDVPRIGDVARLAGVSTATVSRTLSVPGRVHPDTQELVMAAVRRLGYTPNAAARNLRAGRSMTILVVVPRLTNPFFSEIIRGIDETLSAAGYGLIIGDLDNAYDKEAHLVDLAFEGRLDGAIVLSGHMPTSGGRSLQEANIPLVSICIKIPGTDVPYVLVNDRPAVQNAMRHLMALGHRRFAYLAGPSRSYGNDSRYRGFRDALAENEAATGARLKGDYTLESGAAAGRAFLDLSPRPTAVISAGDMMAIGFMKTIRDAGLAIPRDVSIIGFDGLEMSQYCEPPLSTLRQPRRALGRAGANSVLQLLGDPSSPSASLSQTLEVELILRESVGPPPAAERPGQNAPAATTGHAAS